MRRTYREIMRDLPNATHGKECRKLHKELKQYGDALPIFMRYPYLPTIISIIALVVAAIASVLIVLMI